MTAEYCLLSVLQEAELEDFLFAGNANDITGFGREDEEQKERSAVAELIAKVRAARVRLCRHLLWPAGPSARLPYTDEHSTVQPLLLGLSFSIQED